MAGWYRSNLGTAQVPNCEVSEMSKMSKMSEVSVLSQ